MIVVVYKSALACTQAGTSRNYTSSTIIRVMISSYYYYIVQVLLVVLTVTGATGSHGASASPGLPLTVH